MRDSSINVKGISSPLLESGLGQAVEAVVFVHGNPGSSNDWRSLAELVGSFARVIAMDMLGFGAADKPTNFDYSVEGYARHLGALLAASGVRRVDLVLHDFGGPCGLTWAAANPRSIASVTLINTGVLLDYHWHYLAQIWQTRLLGELFMATTTRAGMQLLLRHVNPRGLPREYVEQVYRSLDRGTRRAVLRLYRNSRETQGVMKGSRARCGRLPCRLRSYWPHAIRTSPSATPSGNGRYFRAPRSRSFPTADTGRSSIIPKRSRAPSFRFFALRWGTARYVQRDSDLRERICR
jgi:pimeloyl-ACP methyl ester carboxylesterase